MHRDVCVHVFNKVTSHGVMLSPKNQALFNETQCQAEVQSPKAIWVIAIALGFLPGETVAEDSTQFGHRT